MWAETGIGRDGEKRKKKEEEKEGQEGDQGAEVTVGDLRPEPCLLESRAEDCSRPGHRLVRPEHRGQFETEIANCIHQSLSMDKLSEEAKTDKASRLVKSKHTYYRSVQ